MNWIQRTPFYAWLGFSILLSYAIYNGSHFNLVGLILDSYVPLPIKFLVGTVTFTILLFYAHNIWKTLGIIGISLYVALIMGILWTISYIRGTWEADIITTSVWWIQFPLGFLMALGLQGGKIYAAITGQRIISPGSSGSFDHLGDSHHEGHH